MNIARSIAIAALLAATLLPPASSQEAQGPFRAEVHDLRWTDTARNRTLSLRLRLPAAPGPRPLVLFSHGLGGSVDAGHLWAEHWASHGFAVLHLQHPGSDAAVWSESRQPAADLRQAADGNQLLARVGDVKFVLDELGRRQRAGDPQTARLDLARIGLAGHSFGAITTQAIAGQQYDVPPRFAQRIGPTSDPRPRAFIAFSPSARGREQLPQFAPMTRPFFSITGTEDGMVGLGLGVPPAQRLLPYEGMPPGDKFLLNLNGADHMIFSGGERWRGSADPARDAAQVRRVQATTTAFWRAYLSDDREALAWLRALEPMLGGQGRFEFK
jgi:dienelactone hydrolase